MEFKGIIYCAESPSGKKYYGKTVGLLNHRIHKHLENSKKSKCHFSTAIRKYGIINFSWNIVETISESSKKELRNLLNQKETHWIKTHQTFLREYGYNMTRGGDGGAAFGRILSVDTKQKISKSLMGIKYSGERRKNMSENGKGISRNKGKTLSEEHKRKISKNNGKPNLGKKLSEETKRKISISKKGKNFLKNIKTKFERPCKK